MSGSGNMMTEFFENTKEGMKIKQLELRARCPYCGRVFAALARKGWLALCTCGMSLYLDDIVEDSFESKYIIQTYKVEI